jgi:hypothetical protein
MRNQALLIAVLLAATIAAVFAACDSTNQPRGSPNGVLLDVPVPSAVVSDANKLFPEGSSPHPSVASSEDIIYKLKTNGNVTFTFVWEGAGNRNQFGYFLYNPASTVAPSLVMIFPDCTWKNEGGCMYTGSSVQVGPLAAGSQLGFWIKSDGYSNSKGATYYSIHNTTGPIKNPDGYRHAAWVSTNNVTLIGFEDLNNLGDKDFNDVMFFVTSTAEINDDDIPKFENGTLQVCTDAEITTYTEYQCTQYASLAARNPSSCIGYIRVPAGWTLAPNNADTISAIVAAAGAGVNFGSTCVVLAGGVGINVNTGASCGTGLLKTFKNDASCYNVDCQYTMIIKGQTLSQCSASQDLTCNPATNAKLLSRFPTAQVDIPVYPTQYSIYLSNMVGTAATIDLPVTLKVPATPKVDVMVLVDLNGLSSSNLATLRTQVNTLFGSLNTKSYNPLMGISTVDANGNVKVLTTLTSSTDSVSNALNNIGTSTLTATTSPITRALLNSFYSSTTMGWRRTGTYNTVLVLTAKASSSAVTTADLASASKIGRVFPVFLSLSAVSSSYTTLVASQPFAFSDIFADAYGNIATKAAGLYDIIVKTVEFDTAVDLTPNGFVSSLPAPATGVAFNQVLNRVVTLTYPSGSVNVPTVPFEVDVTVWGYGTLAVMVSVNRAPTVVSKPTIAMNEDSSVNFEVAGQDADGNILNVVYLSVEPSTEQVGFRTTSGNALVFNSQSYTDFSGQYVPTSNYYGATVLRFLVRDGCVNSTVGTLTFQVNNVNDAPVARPMWRTINEDTSATFFFNETIINDIDNDWSTLTVFIQSFPSSDPTRLGIGNAAGSSFTALTSSAIAPVTVTNKYLRYTPVANWFGQVIFGYYVQDPGTLSSASTITVDVLPVNDAPSSQNIVLRTKEDTPITFVPTAADIDGDKLTFEITSLPVVGTVVRTGGSVITLGKFTSNPDNWSMTYTPPADQYNATSPLTTFKFKVNDNGVPSLSSPEYTISIYVDPENDPPVASNIYVQTLEDNNASVDFTTYISDVDDTVASLKVYIKSPPLTSLGRLVDTAPITTNNFLLSGKIASYQPYKDQNGLVTFTYYVKDPSGLVSNDATVTVNVTAVNDPPVLTAPTTTFVAKVGGSVSVTLSMTDADLGSSEELTLQVISNTLGTLVPNLSVTIGNAADVGTAIASGATPTLATKWPNTDDGSARVTILTWNPTTPATPGSSGQFTVRAQDKKGDFSSSIAINLTIAVNSPPTVTTPTPQIINEDNNATSIRLFGTDSDAIDVSSLKLIISKLPTNGKLKHGSSFITTTGFRLTTTGDLTGTTAFVDYVPNKDYNGKDSFKFFATDNAGASSAEATGEITINPINDAPVGSDVTVRGPEDTVIAITTIDANDVDGDVLTLEILTMPAKVLTFRTSTGDDIVEGTTLKRDSASWNLNYQAPANAHSTPTGSTFTSFTYRFTDGHDGASPTYTAFIIVDPVNDPPVGLDFTVTTPEDTPIVFNFTTFISDVDGDALTITVQSLPGLGLLNSGTDGNTFNTAVTTTPTTLSIQKIKFVPSLNANGNTVFTYMVSDPYGGTDTGVVTIIVTPVNDPPVSQSIVLRTLEDTMLNFTLSGSDVENDAVSLVILSLPSTGDLLTSTDSFYIRDTPHSVNSPAAFSYNPPQNFFTAPNAPLVFSFYAYDGQDRSVATYTVTIYVDSVNDAPTSEDVFARTKEDTPVSFNLPALDAEDDSTLLKAIVTGVSDARGTFYTSSAMTVKIVTGTILTNPRTVYFVPAENAFSNPTTAPLASLKFQVQDTEGLVSVAEYNAFVYVTPVNDAPLYDGASVLTIDEDTSIEVALMNQVSDVDDTVSSDMTVTITAITGRGVFSECAEDSAACERITLVKGSTLKNAEWRFTFVPLKDENGNNYASITFTINDGHDDSIPYTITINVRPVNDAPVINPFYNVLPGRVDMDEDTTLEISWNVTDIDSPLNTLRTFVTSKLPVNGKMFACNVQEDGSCARGDELTFPTEIPATTSATATWRLIFVPDANAFDAKNFATFNIYAEDDYEARSVTVKAILRVLPINDAPTITSADTYQITRETDGETRFLLSNVVVNDIDAFRKKIVFGIRLADENQGRLEAEGSNADLAFKGSKAPCVLNEAKTEVICTDPQADINVWLSSAVAFYPANTTGTFNLFLYVDDLGNTDKFQRPLTANKTITVLVNEDTGLLPDTPTDNTGIAVGLSVGGAAAIAGIAVLIAKLRRKNELIDNYFDNLTDTIQTGANNPMYQAAYADAANPLYKARN